MKGHTLDLIFDLSAYLFDLMSQVSFNQKCVSLCQLRLPRPKPEFYATKAVGPLLMGS